jgi:hypothetical protein
MTWVQNIAQAFINGYNDGHSNFTYISVSTNNSEDLWTCTTSGVDSRWYTAGVQWGQLFGSKGLTSTSLVYVESGNDIESWKNEYGDGWEACGQGAESWYDGFESAASGAFNYDFGTDGYAEDSLSGLWTQQQVYDVVFGRPSAYGLPEIYCDGNKIGWVSLRAAFPWLVYLGVTSDNAYSNLCGANGTDPTLLSLVT